LDLSDSKGAVPLLKRLWKAHDAGLRQKLLAAATSVERGQGRAPAGTAPWRGGGHQPTAWALRPPNILSYDRPALGHNISLMERGHSPGLANLETEDGRDDDRAARVRRAWWCAEPRSPPWAISRPSPPSWATARGCSHRRGAGTSLQAPGVRVALIALGGGEGRGIGSRAGYGSQTRRLPTPGGSYASQSA
jgi:hypothetical protein